MEFHDKLPKPAVLCLNEERNTLFPAMVMSRWNCTSVFIIILIMEWKGLGEERGLCLQSFHVILHPLFPTPTGHVQDLVMHFITCFN